jgi:hypothetical protein
MYLPNSLRVGGNDDAAIIRQGRLAIRRGQLVTNWLCGTLCWLNARLRRPLALAKLPEYTANVLA